VIRAGRNLPPPRPSNLATAQEASLPKERPVARRRQSLPLCLLFILQSLAFLEFQRISARPLALYIVNHVVARSTGRDASCRAPAQLAA
jgi:hypothetical protein